MEKYLKKLPQELKRIIRFAEEVSKETAMPAYLVGGFLRDLILGVKNYDLDITVEGSGIVFAQKLAKKLKADLRIHERFGTATLTIRGGLKIDIATTRKESYPTSACLPVVTSGSLEQDLIRRDFTINAMAFCISSASREKLIDPFGGSSDLDNGIIRILHNCSFRDDPTRILRAVRFKMRFNFKIEPNTLGLLKEAVKGGFLNKVNLHRLRDELILMLKENDPYGQLNELYNLGGLSFISNKIKVNKITRDFFKAINKEISWFNKNFSHRRKLDIWLMYFIALIKPLSFIQAKKIALDLALCKGEAKRILDYKHSCVKLISALIKKDLKPAQIFSLLEPLSYEVIILLKASLKNKYLHRHIADFLEIYNGMRLYVCGKDLGGLGVLPGPRYKKIFTLVLEAKLNGQVKGRSDELAMIKKLLK